jgi:hypothetical protein
MRDTADLTSRRAAAAKLVDNAQARFHQNRQITIVTTPKMWYNSIN